MQEQATQCSIVPVVLGLLRPGQNESFELHPKAPELLGRAFEVEARLGRKEAVLDAMIRVTEIIGVQRHCPVVAGRLIDLTLRSPWLRDSVQKRFRGLKAASMSTSTSVGRARAFLGFETARPWLANLPQVGLAPNNKQDRALGQKAKVRRGHES